MPSVFTRSLINVADESLAVVLPISWLRYYKLKPGDKVEVIANGDITIRPLPKAVESSEELPASTKGEDAGR